MGPVSPEAARNRPRVTKEAWPMGLAELVPSASVPVQCQSERLPPVPLSVLRSVFPQFS